MRFPVLRTRLAVSSQFGSMTRHFNALSVSRDASVSLSLGAFSPSLIPIQTRRSLHLTLPIHTSLTPLKPRNSVRHAREAWIRSEAASRWIPTGSGNLKRQRSNLGHSTWAKTQPRKRRLKQTVYATRSQLRKLKKILPHGYFGGKVGGIKRRGKVVPLKPMPGKEDKFLHY